MQAIPILTLSDPAHLGTGHLASRDAQMLKLKARGLVDHCQTCLFSLKFKTIREVDTELKEMGL
jgi:hypothetical protein